MEPLSPLDPTGKRFSRGTLDASTLAAEGKTYRVRKEYP